MKPFGFFLVLVVACGSSTTTDGDGGTDGAISNDATNNDAANGSDAASNGDGSNPNDSSTPSDAGVGTPCDPQNSVCASKGLLCCSEPTHGGDAGLTAFVCEQPVNNGCPKLP